MATPQAYKDANPNAPDGVYIANPEDIGAGAGSGEVEVTALPEIAAPFTDASVTIGTARAALASHAFRYAFYLTNTHATQNLHLGDASVESNGSRKIVTILPGETRTFPGVGNTDQFQVVGSAAGTTYLLGGY